MVKQPIWVEMELVEGTNNQCGKVQVGKKCSKLYPLLDGNVGMTLGNG